MNIREIKIRVGKRLRSLKKQRSLDPQPKATPHTGLAKEICGFICMVGSNAALSAMHALERLKKLQPNRKKPHKDWLFSLLDEVQVDFGNSPKAMVFDTKTDTKTASH